MDVQEFFEQAEDRILAIYPQQRYHSNAYIVGGKAGLLDLRNAIDQALNDPNRQMGVGVGIALAHPSDQETFTTFVIHDVDCDQAEERDNVHLDDMPLPYYDPKCADQLRDGVVGLAPDERHIMAAGVALYRLNERIKAAESTEGESETNHS